MQVSIQTDRKKKNNFANNSFSVPPIENTPNQLDDKDKKLKIKRLTLINKQLIETLKKQNDDLTKKINKQKGKPQNRSFSVSTSQTPKYLQSTKKQLANAYKQIEMYKAVLQNLKAKQISTESLDKINMLENRIKMEDQAIEDLQKQIKFLKNIKDQQQKELQVFQNQEIKKNVTELQDEVKNLRQKLKVAKKHTFKRQELQKKQHAYFLELQKMLRIQNDQYYPGKQQIKKEVNSNSTKDLSNQITQKQWQSAKLELKQLKHFHQQTNKKIELLSRQRNKQLKSLQQNEIKLKQKMKKLQQLKNKLSQLTKLVTIKQKKQTQEQEQVQEDENETESVQKSPKKPAKPKKERQVKRWVIPQGYALEKGKILSDSIFFSDKTILKNVKKSKIVEIHVWTDSQDNPCIKGKRHQGIQPYPHSMNHLEQNIITLKQGDYLYKIEGKMDHGYLTSLTLVSKFGQKRSFINQSSTTGDVFMFEPRPNQLPSCLFGAIVKKDYDEIRICHIGCQFISDW